MRNTSGHYDTLPTTIEGRLEGKEEDLRPIYTRRYSGGISIARYRALVQSANFYLFLRDTRAVPRPIASGAIFRRDTAPAGYRSPDVLLTNQRFCFDKLIVDIPLMRRSM